MSTDKLHELHNTVAEILSEPPAPTTFFDEEPGAAARTGEQAAGASENRQGGADISKENIGKPTSRKFGISPTEIHEAHSARDAENESSGIVRQAIAERTRLSYETANSRSDSQTASIDSYRQAAPGNRISPGGWAVRGLAFILLAAGIGVGGVIWLGSPGDAARTAPLQPAPLVQTVPAVATSPELTPLLQSMARDLASMGKEIEQLKARRELMIRENAKLSEQFKASQEQMTRAVAELSEQLKVSQEQQTRDNANVVGQIKGVQDQLTSVVSRVSELNAAPRIAAAPPRPVAPAVRKPVPTLSSAPAAAQHKPEKPKPASTSRPPAPTR